MEITSTWISRVPALSIRPTNFYFHRPSQSVSAVTSQTFSSPLYVIPMKSFLLRAGKRNSQPDPVLNPTTVEDVYTGNEDEDFEDDDLLDDDLDFSDDEYMEDDDSELYVGDGGGGGGVVLAGLSWDKDALRIAEEVCLSLDGELGLYAFKTFLNSKIEVRIERLTNKSGSPTMKDIEAFSKAYRSKLDEAELAKTIPDNISLEVSSPGVERVVRIPEDLDRFKDRPMYVKYISEVSAEASLKESDCIFRLVSFDIEEKCCTWGVANVRINREKAGKGRPLNKKQRDWRLTTPFHSLRIVRIYPEM